MKSDRLFNIIYILLNKKTVTAKELAQEFEVSTRTIYRDVETLSMAGLPIYTDKGTGGGIKLLDDFVFDKSLITGDEKNDIILALDMLRATAYKDSSDTIDKLGALFNKSNTTYVDIDFSGFQSNDEKAIFSKLKTALSNNKALNMKYKSYDRETKSRVVFPLKLVFKKHNWYLVAYCKTRNDYRTFRISRIQSVEILDQTYDRDSYNVDDYDITYGSSNNEIVITLKLDMSALNRVEEDFKNNYKVIDGNIILSFESVEDKHLYSYILSYLESIVDVSPSHIKDNLKEKVKKFLII